MEGGRGTGFLDPGSGRRFPKAGRWDRGLRSRIFTARPETARKSRAAAPGVRTSTGGLSFPCLRCTRRSASSAPSQAPATTSPRRRPLSAAATAEAARWPSLRRHPPLLSPPIVLLLRLFLRCRSARRPRPSSARPPRRKKATRRVAGSTKRRGCRRRRQERRRGARRRGRKRRGERRGLGRPEYRGRPAPRRAATRKTVLPVSRWARPQKSGPGRSTAEGREARR